eukprot:COSAG06_NODE_408_length_16107_cov_14.957154_10_plen_64_part_00
MLKYKKVKKSCPDVLLLAAQVRAMMGKGKFLGLLNGQAASKLYGERMLRHYEQAEQQVVKLAQ